MGQFVPNKVPVLSYSRRTRGFEKPHVCFSYSLFISDGNLLFFPLYKGRFLSVLHRSISVISLSFIFNQVSCSFKLCQLALRCGCDLILNLRMSLWWSLGTLFFLYSQAAGNSYCSRRLSPVLVAVFV